MQLYEMKKDGNSVSSSTVVLMVTAVCYKLVLVCIRYISADFQGKCCGNILADISVCIFWVCF
ncbi:MAG: hypothetical protein ACLUD0_04920 [Eubacterium ramulus]